MVIEELKNSLLAMEAKCPGWIIEHIHCRVDTKDQFNTMLKEYGFDNDSRVNKDKYLRYYNTKD